MTYLEDIIYCGGEIGKGIFFTVSMSQASSSKDIGKGYHKRNIGCQW